MQSSNQRSRHLLLPLLLALVTGPFAQGEAELAVLAAAARARAGAPGLGCMVLREGDTPRIAVDGVRVAGEPAAVTAADAWHWGSITKSMTATLVARLVEKGEVSWDDSLGELLFELVPEMELDFGDATFEHLLSHHAGLPANIPLPRFGEFGQDPEDPIAERLKWVRIALQQKPIGSLGKTFSYSNNGYVVAGAMLEAATGSSWEALMEREVFAPLGITGAGFGAPLGDQPRGHVGAERQPVPPNTDNPAALGPAGRVHMPLADMARYLAAHARRDPEFLSEASWDRLHRPPFTGTYALGWIARDANGRWHNGSNTMWFAEVAFDRATGAVAAVAVNDGHLAEVQPAVSELLGRLLTGEVAATEAKAPPR